ncbi:hypothetical protein HY639_03125, partial [Candidatus Woesearchaeota archaeon]|nr:hypothetical protein [Candidatus Woesearchaeota archaeon]
GIHITGHTYCNATLHAQSTKNDFERLYKVELVLETKPCPDGPIIGFNVDKQPSVPKELEDIVKSITIIQDVVLTDLLD